MITIKSTEITYRDSGFLEKNMRILLKDSRISREWEKFNFNSTLEFNLRLPEGPALSRMLQTQTIQQEIKCSAQGNIAQDNLNINLISLSFGESQVLGTGVTKGFKEKNPFLDIKFINSAVLLRDINFLKENFAADGNVFLAMDINGPLDNAKISLNGMFFGCQGLSIKGFSGKFEYGNRLFLLNQAHLLLDSLPLDMQLSAKISDQPEFSLRADFLEGYFQSNNLPLTKLQAQFNGKITSYLTGDLKINARYTRKDTSLDLRALLKDIYFDYANPERKTFSASSLELTKGAAPGMQKLKFQDLKSEIHLEKNRINIRGIRLLGYDAPLGGELNLLITDKPSLTFAMEGKGLDVKTLMQDSNISDKLLSGKMEVNIAFDNRRQEFLEGSCYIKDGSADLQAIEEVIKLPPLNKDFESIGVNFSLTKERTIVKQMEMLNKDFMLGASWSTNTNLEGKLYLKISTQLLNKSATFRRLLRLTKIQKPYIDLSFLVGGIPRAPRIMWLKGEFRDKIKEGLSAGTKSSIQENIDKTIDELSKGN